MLVDNIFIDAKINFANTFAFRNVSRALLHAEPLFARNEAAISVPLGLKRRLARADSVVRALVAALPPDCPHAARQFRQ